MLGIVDTEVVPDVDVKIIDGSTIVHMLDPKKSKQSVKSFHYYSQFVFLPYIEHMLESVVRIDVVWDITEKNLKAETPQNLGTGYPSR